MPVVHKRASAKRDLVELFVYLGEHAGIDTAERFLANAAALKPDNRGRVVPGRFHRGDCSDFLIY